MNLRSLHGESLPPVGRMTDQELHHYANEEQLAGAHDAALPFFTEAARRHPGHPGILLGLLKCRRKLGNFEQLAEITRTIQNLIANHPALIDLLGEELQAIHEYDLALETFAMLRKFPEARVRAVGRAREAVLHLRLRRRSEAEDALSEAVNLCPDLPEVRLARALSCRADDPALARTILLDLSIPKPSVPAPFTAACCHTLAAVCDALDLPDEAMTALARGKAIEEQQPLVRRFREERPRWRQWHLDASALDHAQATSRANAFDSGHSPAHAFLLGHPRSGTTLLEQILDAHPDIRSVEESDVFSTSVESKLIRQHDRDGGGIPFADWLRQRPEPELDILRETYFRNLSREAPGNPAGMTMIDKNPALTLSVAMLARILPCARLIVVLRDPRDVCLSAYFQSTHRTPWSVNWLTLAETVEQYAFAMDLWLQARSGLAQPWMEVRYEDVVRDPEREGKRVTGFLGLEWDAAQLDPAAHARSKIIHSPTHAEVVQPVYRHAVGKWRRYAEHLLRYQERLKPFVHAFGYSAD